jgi:hypothetical protein
MAKSKFPNKEDLINQIMVTSDFVWKNQITREKLDSWLNNFTGELFAKKYEQDLALWLLVNFVFYNEQEVKHLCATLYRDFIHEKLLANNEKQTIEEELERIHSSVRFHYLGRSGESGAFLLYYFRKENMLSVRDFVNNLDNIPDEVTEIVYVDDVTLSSHEQSQAYLYLMDDLDKISGKRISILTLIASQSAIDFLKSKGLNVINCITLEDRDKCFSTESNIFQNHNDHIDDCKLMVEHYGSKIYHKHPLGYNDCQYTFGFFYNTPDNSLPIFWSRNNGWEPIIERYDKHYGKTKFTSLGRFV